MHRCCFAILLTLLLVSPVFAGILYDFEQPFFVETPPNICKDHALIKQDDTYHIFYIHSLPAPEGWSLRSEFWLGHLTSPDLCNWTRQDSILPVSDVPDSWEGGFIWAPKAVPNPNGPGWYLYYTGVEIPSIAQQTGLAFSFDLFDWYRYGPPVYRPGAWSSWQEGTWSDCRDPEILFDGEDYYMLNTAMTADRHGAISIARSSNLLDWEDMGPLIVNNNDFVFESPQMVHAGGLYHLFFTEQWVGHTSHMSSFDMLSGWDLDDNLFIDMGAAPEISDLGDEIIFSRHTSAYSINGPYYSYRFDRMEFHEGEHLPEIIRLDGLKEEWTQILGDCFNTQPTFKDNPVERGQMSCNLEGNSYVSTFENYSYPLAGPPGGMQGNSPFGVLRNAAFTLTENRVSLLVGGGEEIERTFVGLARSSNDRMLFMEAGDENFGMSRRIWNTESLIGEEVYLVIADLETENWGFISVDTIREYTETGVDSLPPALPLVAGPWLEDLIEASGVTTAVDNQKPEIAANAGRLFDPYPNPFNPRTRLRYEIDAPGRVELRIVDPSGRSVRRLDAGERQAGPGYFSWLGLDDRGAPMASGVYLASLLYDGKPIDERRLILLR